MKFLFKNKLDSRHLDFVTVWSIHRPLCHQWWMNRQEDIQSITLFKSCAMLTSKLIVMFCLNGTVVEELGPEAGSQVWFPGKGGRAGPGGPKSNVQGGGLGGPCTVRSHASWVMLTWGSLLWTDRITDTHDWKNYFPTTPLPGDNNWTQSSQVPNKLTNKQTFLWSTGGPG